MSNAYAPAAAGKPDISLAHFNPSAALGQLGRGEEAGVALSRAFEVQPDHGPGFFQMGWPFKDAADFEHLMDGLRKAGLRE